MAKLVMKPWTDRNAERDPEYKVYSVGHRAAYACSWRRIKKAMGKVDAGVAKLGNIELKLVKLHLKCGGEEMDSMMGAF